MARQRSLNSQDDIRRALANVYRRLESDELDPQKGRVLIYCALSLSNVLRDSDLEARLEALENGITRGTE